VRAGLNFSSDAYHAASVCMHPWLNGIAEINAYGILKMKIWLIFTTCLLTLINEAFI